MNLICDVIQGKDIDDVSTRLIFEAMLDENISGKADMEGLTTDEVKRIVDGKTVNRIIVDGEVVGVFNPGYVDRSNFVSWNLDKTKSYSRIGFVFIDKPHRNKGYAVEVMRRHIEGCENYAECCEENNAASNAMLSKVLKFHKRAHIWMRDAWYNIYVK